MNPEQQVGILFAGGFSLVLILFFSMLACFFLGTLILWVWMIIDCAQREFLPPKQDQKIIWILVIVLAGWIGALIYYLVVKRPEDLILKAAGSAAKRRGRPTKTAESYLDSAPPRA